MKRMKTFFTYAIIIAVFWLFSNILIYIAINGTYKHIDARVYSNSPEITIGQSKATYINGFVKGSIKNNTQGNINEKYLKIDLYSAHDVKLGTKYVRIENLQQNASQEFEMWYKFTDVNYATITVTDNVRNATEEEFLSQETASYIVVGTLLLLYFM